MTNQITATSVRTSMGYRAMLLSTAENTTMAATTEMTTHPVGQKICAQWGRRSSTTCSLSLSSLGGNGTTATSAAMDDRPPKPTRARARAGGGDPTGVPPAMREGPDGPTES